MRRRRQILSEDTPMALGVDLLGLREEGTVVWRWMCRFWSGRDVIDLVGPPPSEAPLSWQGPITPEQIETLRNRAGGREREAEFRASQRAFGCDVEQELDVLLALRVHQVVVRVEEWGYG